MNRPNPNPNPTPSTVPRAGAVVAGVSSAAFGLATAELVAACSGRLRSPILDVGDRIVDLVPAGVKDLAIALFGTNDKPALLIGIAVLLIGYAGAVGLIAFRARPTLAVAGVGLFGAIGSAASLLARTDVVWFAPLPTVVGSVMTAAVLVMITRRFAPPAPKVVDPMLRRPNDRRRFLATIGAVSVGAAAVAVTGRQIDQHRADAIAADRATSPFPPPAAALAAAPPSVQARGAAPFYTPNADFYRIDTALTVPRLSLDRWTLTISGLVDKPDTYTFEQLTSTFTVVESDITLTCVSNTVGGDLVGTARWRGVRLDEVLERAGIAPDADQIVGRSSDGYTCGFPVGALDGRDALIAFGMNGEPLPPEHGYPARLIVPGLYGYVSATKWLTEIELTTFDAFDHYWVPRGYAAEAPIRQQSRIDSPRGLDRIKAGPTAIAGVAWAQTVGISAVEISIDEGPWMETELADELNDSTWRQWSLPWEATPGRHTITVRSRNSDGAIQTDERSEPLPDGATGHHTIVVLVDT